MQRSLDGEGRSNAAAKTVVFLAEDDPELRSTLAETLRQNDFEVRTAADGKSLLALLTESSRKELAMPSLIVTDLRMPRCSGLNVLTVLRLAEWDVPVVLITGFGDRAVHEDAATLGAAAVLDKPFDPDTLLRVLRAALRRRETREADAKRSDPILVREA